MSARPLVDAIDEILPQTQCRRCGFEGCRPYAEALAEPWRDEAHEADILAAGEVTRDDRRRAM